MKSTSKTHGHIARLPGQGKKSHHKGQGKVRTNDTVRKEELAEVTEYKVLGHGNDSRHWAPRIDECDAFGDVIVYDAQGRQVRVIKRAQLMRPWRARKGNTWNNSVFPKRISDKEPVSDDV